MSGKELIKKMIKDGWVLERINGSHHVMKKGNRTEIIPVHGNKDIPNGLLIKILKRAGL
jgi:predicted RNA binding protein YcfA (HicA-like mRNA interferase family)